MHSLYFLILHIYNISVYLGGLMLLGVGWHFVGGKGELFQQCLLYIIFKILLK